MVRAPAGRIGFVHRQDTFFPVVFVDENYHMHRAGPLDVKDDFLESRSDLSLLDHYADPWSRSLNSASVMSIERTLSETCSVNTIRRTNTFGPDGGLGDGTVEHDVGASDPSRSDASAGHPHGRLPVKMSRAGDGNRTRVLSLGS